jgi:Histidine kinase-, DNA gyrase B-, and HSP90-like ATPase
MQVVRDSDVDTQPIGITEQFQLGIDEGKVGLAMDILIDMYKDPIETTIRELCANAYDAHIAAKVYTPIEVTLPSAISPYLVVKDLGQGMSRLFLTNNYSRLLSSTKSDDNKHVGGYGIGSKSPLGYTDSYTLSTRQGGKEIHLHVSRSGGFSILGENEATEPDGTTVIVPVKPGDFTKFERATHWLRYMEPAPLINGQPIPKEEVLIEGDDWFMVKADTALEIKPLILLGPIPYSISAYNLPSTDNHRLVGLLKASYFRYKFPIGSLSLTRSRESIRYDERTVHTIMCNLLLMYDKIQSSLLEYIEGMEYVSNIRTFLRKQYLCTLLFNSNAYISISASLPIEEKWYIYYASSSGKVMRQVQHNHPEECEVFLHDNPPRWRARINHYIESNRKVRVLVGPVDTTVNDGTKNVYRTRLLSELELPPLVVASGKGNITTTTNKVLKRLPKGKVWARKWDAGVRDDDRLGLYTHTTDVGISLNGQGYYIPMSMGKVRDPLLTGATFTDLDIERFRIMLGATDEPLYVVSPKLIPKLGPEWSNLFTQASEYIYPWLGWMKHLYSISRSLYRFVDIGEEFYMGGYLLEYDKLYREVDRVIDPPAEHPWRGVLSIYRNCMPLLWDSIPVDHNMDPLLNLRDIVHALYPMLSKCYCHYKVPLCSYMQMVDSHLGGQEMWFSSCYLPGTEVDPDLNGRELMIHYYDGKKGNAGDVRSYYDRYGCP